MPDDPKAARHAAPPDDDPARSGRDHRAISQLADDLLPALIAKLASSGLGEIEVRESGWRARLRKPAVSEAARRSAALRGAGEAHSGSGHAGSGHAAGRAQGTGRPARSGETGQEPEVVPISATSPAVGIYHPRRDLSEGMRVRTGEKIGTVDVLGVNQDVLVPVDGVIGSSMAEAGEAVEYGQDLVRIELMERGPMQVTAPAPIELEPAVARGNA
jgi:biotin carboxyl carrier protein